MNEAMEKDRRDDAKDGSPPKEALTVVEQIRESLQLNDHEVMPIALAVDIESMQPLPSETGIAERELPPGAYFTDATNTVLTPAGKTPLNVLGAELRMANKPGLTIHDESHNDNPDATQPSDATMTNDSSCGQEGPSHSRSADLLVANLVNAEEEEQTRNLPHAEEYDPEAPHGSRARSKDNNLIANNPWMVWAVGVVLVAAITIILVFTLADGSSNKTSSVYAPNATDSPRPSTNFTLTLEDRILSLLPDHAHLRQATSPQSRAFNWILDDPTVEEYSNWRIQQRYALATVYFSTGGETWAENDYWLSYIVHECNWYGKKSFALKESLVHVYDGYLEGLFPSTDPPPATCHKDGSYQHLWLDQNNLVGSLPRELYMLTSLKTLSTGLNQLFGTIATEIGQLSQLEGLAVFSHENGGTIPSEIELLTHLQFVGLHDNNHEGSIPSEFWQLTKLETFISFQNLGLKFTIPTEIGTFPKLKWLVVEDCGLTGTLPTELGQIDTLEWLVVPGNHLSGTIPNELALIPNLLMITLHRNLLEGTLPTELGLLTSSKLLSFSSNILTGTIPTELGLSASLTLGMRFESNHFSGTLPTQLSNIRSMYELSFLDNNLTGGIPSEFGLLTSVGHLNLGSNLLTGTIPHELSHLQQSLYELTLSGNELLSGTIPQSLCNINGTCQLNRVASCVAGEGLHFDCSGALCGCGCSCEA
ncbi:Leucine Rich Repeat [Seminavis robusta]|uniref:Leucine Rich Repeat n=1 Tax=Seminavis robusta TaxID=568900 RepID=A0A9N8HW91_9STRA|nr:Leucine Rich Repeat [Seminavis robusta]|eukprot:Sro2158_g316950.1 Leucine Rich Repeat (705) ;mRNA; f:8838-11059